MSGTDLSQLSMIQLFQMEAESQTQVLTAGLLALERDPSASEPLDACMRAAHSLKGAARIVGLEAVVSVTHALEDCFVAARQGRLTPRKPQIDLLLDGVDLITRLAASGEAELARPTEPGSPAVEQFLSTLARLLKVEADAQEALPHAPAADQGRREVEGPVEARIEAASPPERNARVDAPPPRTQAESHAPALAQAGAPAANERVLRVTAQSFDRLLGLSAEALVESRRLAPFASSLLKLKRLQHEAGQALEHLRDALSEEAATASAREALSQAALAAARSKLLECQQLLGQRMLEFESCERRAGNVAQRLYGEALRCRMRPFGDGAHGLPRMVRDLAHALGKRVRFELVGEATQVDRDVLEKLEAPLAHLLRNAVDHGIDAPAARRAVGKSEEGSVRLEARHAAGMLQIGVSDDGQGIDLERVRATVLARGLSDPDTAAKLSATELYEFLFLPGFSLRDQVTDISGRGVGLDAVHNFVKQLRGSVRITSQAGQGTRFDLQLPLTVSVVRTLLAEIAGEPYAFPLAHVERALTLAQKDVQALEGRQHFSYGARQIGLVTARQIFAGGAAQGSEELPVLVLAERDGSYGLVVDRFLGARELVIQVLDPRLGKIKDISAGALLEDGTPVLIVDVEDLIRSIQKLISSGQLTQVRYNGAADERARRKRVLVVDDSLTVRELERKLLDRGGYEVEVAVDGADGWNAVRASAFDLVVTDIDMPRMDGIELLELIRRDPRLSALPVMIVSYKDREEDRRRGLDAGADFYLAKASFHNESLLQAVLDLIGAP